MRTSIAADPPTSAGPPPRRDYPVAADWPGATWRLDGIKRYCSGAHSCTHALVTATDRDADHGFGPVLPPAIVAHFARHQEVLLR